MQLSPGGRKKGWGALSAGVVLMGALFAIGLALGVPGQVGCGTEEAAVAKAQTSAALNADCVEQVVTHDGTCEDLDGTGVRTCTLKGAEAKSAKCPKGCQAGAVTFTWKDVFGDAASGPAPDLAVMCENRKPPGLDCTYVERLPCSP